MALKNLSAAVASKRAKATLELHKRIVELTPYKSGAAKLNWIVSAGKPSNEVRKLTGVINLSSDQAESIAISAAEAVVANAKPGEALYIQNNLPYIELLENGSSKQAPSGMTAIAMAELAAKRKN